MVNLLQQHLFFFQGGLQFLRAYRHLFLERVVEHLEVALGLSQLAVLPDGILVGGQQEVQDALVARADHLAFAVERGIHLFRPILFLRTHRPFQEVVHPGQKMILVVRLGQVEIRAGLQPPDNILRVGQRGQQDDRHILQRRVVFDRAAQLVAVHLRHHHVADHDGRLSLPGCGQSLPAVCGHRHVKAVLLEQVFDLRGLRGAVLHHQYLRSPVRSAFSRVGDLLLLLEDKGAERLNGAERIPQFPFYAREFIVLVDAFIHGVCLPSGFGDPDEHKVRPYGILTN